MGTHSDRRAEQKKRQAVRRRMIADFGGLVCVGLFAGALYLLMGSESETLHNAGQRARLATWFDPFITLFCGVLAMRWRLLRNLKETFKNVTDAIWIFMIVLMGSAIVGGALAAVLQAEDPVFNQPLPVAIVEAILFRMGLGLLGASWWYIPILVGYIKFTRFWTFAR